MNSEFNAKRTITVIEGDGVGPEITSLTVDLMRASGAIIDVELAEAGGVAFGKGIVSGVPQETLDSVERNKVVLKGPLATPIGEGGKSANVTLRKTFEMFANIRPARELPGIPSPFSGRGIDLVIIRENVEDLYAGIEHMQTPNVAQCLKLISRVGSARIAEATFAFALSQGRSSVVVATKANIMKLTEGLFKSEFERVAKGYSNIESSHMLIDNCAHQLVMKPEDFDVIVTTNMNGDILSDLASGLVGGLGFSPSANLGYEVAMFEAVHGTAPDIAGKNKANPTAMILSGVMLLRHIEEFAAADRL
jgi:isocitrate dehydrogenase